MRLDKEGNYHTLEEDIREIWKQHGWKVIKESCPRFPRLDVPTWIIEADSLKVESAEEEIASDMKPLREKTIAKSEVEDKCSECENKQIYLDENFELSECPFCHKVNMDKEDFKIIKKLFYDSALDDVEKKIREDFAERYSSQNPDSQTAYDLVLAEIKTLRNFGGVQG